MSARFISHSVPVPGAAPAAAVARLSFGVRLLRTLHLAARAPCTAHIPWSCLPPVRAPISLHHPHLPLPKEPCPSPQGNCHFSHIQLLEMGWRNGVPPVSYGAADLAFRQPVLLRKTCLLWAWWSLCTSPLSLTHLGKLKPWALLQFCSCVMSTLTGSVCFRFSCQYSSPCSSLSVFHEGLFMRFERKKKSGNKTQMKEIVLFRNYHITDLEGIVMAALKICTSISPSCSAD